MNKNLVESLRRGSPQSQLKRSCIERVLEKNPQNESDRGAITPYRYKEEGAALKSNTVNKDMEASMQQVKDADQANGEADMPFAKLSLAQLREVQSAIFDRE